MQTEEQVVLDVNPFADSPDTPELAAPTRRADAHRVKVDGVSLMSTEKGSRFRIALTSLDMGVTINDDIFLPQDYVNNPRVNPDALQESSDFKENEKGQYASKIHNKARTAVLDKYLAYAISQGRTVTAGCVAKETIEAVAETLNEILSGVELIVIRKPSGEFLNVKGHEPIEKAGDAKFLSKQAKADVAVRWLQ